MLNKKLFFSKKSLVIGDILHNNFSKRYNFTQSKKNANKSKHLTSEIIFTVNILTKHMYRVSRCRV